jgi:hypothetical protein
MDAVTGEKRRLIVISTQLESKGGSQPSGCCGSESWIAKVTIRVVKARRVDTVPLSSLAEL